MRVSDRACNLTRESETASNEMELKFEGEGRRYQGTNESGKLASSEVILMGLTRILSAMGRQWSILNRGATGPYMDVEKLFLAVV